MGFSLLFYFLMVPLTSTLLLLRIISRERVYGNMLRNVWLVIFGLILLIKVSHFFTDKKELRRKDIYGQYVIDRTKYPGKQADWQYNHYRFEITEQNKFIFYQTDNDSIVKKHFGRVDFLDAYKIPRIVIDVDSPAYHIIQDNPTLYRTVWGFYYVFYSPVYGNMFFKKGEWEPID